MQNIKKQSEYGLAMDTVGFNQSEAQISLCSWFTSCNKTNIKCSPLLKKALGMKVIKFSDPPVY